MSYLSFFKKTVFSLLLFYNFLNICYLENASHGFAPKPLLVLNKKKNHSKIQKGQWNKTFVTRKFKFYYFLNRCIFCSANWIIYRISIPFYSITSKFYMSKINEYLFTQNDTKCYLRPTPIEKKRFQIC